MRAVWIAAAGACIAIGVGCGTAQAAPDQAGPSAKESSTTAGPSAADASAPVKDVAKQHDSKSDGATASNGPTSSVTASSIAVHRDKKDRGRTPKRSVPTPQTPTDDDATAQTSTPSVSKSSVGKTSVSTTVAGPAVSGPARAVEKSPVVEKAPVAAKVGAVEPNEPADPAAARHDTPPDTVLTNDAATTTAKKPESKALVAASTALVEHATPAPAATVARSAPEQPGGPLVGLVLNVLSAVGLLPAGPAAPAVIVPSSGTSSPGVVTGVVTGRAPIDIPVGNATYTGASDWYFPTQADGTVQAQGVTYLQHGFLGDKSWYSALARQLAQQTNNVVVVTNVPSFPFFTCGGCTLSGAPMQQGVADLFIDPNRTALNASATAAGFQGTLPTAFVLTGHSAGGGLVTGAGGLYAAAVPADRNDLLGVVMFDGVSSNGTFATAIANLNARNIPVYQIAAPPQPWNANGQTTADLIALRPGEFVGDVLANGSHVDSLIGGQPLIDVISQALIKPSPPGNTEAVYTLASGWINDLYAGHGPTDPLYGIYGAPRDYVTLGQASAVVLGPPPVVDVDRYLGTWYEVGSVKQFFSVGLVNTKAVYASNPDGSIRVENSGNYFFSNGPQSDIVGAALPLNPENDKLNVTFFGPPSATPPGNYWIVDLAPDYGWAVVTDPSRTSAFLLSRTPIVSDALYQQLLDRASAAGVTGSITRTPQPGAANSSIAA